MRGQNQLDIYVSLRSLLGCQLHMPHDPTPMFIRLSWSEFQEHNFRWHEDRLRAFDIQAHRIQRHIAADVERLAICIAEGTVGGALLWHQYLAD